MSLNNFNRAVAYYQNNNNFLAIQELHKFLSISPTHFEANFLLGIIYGSVERFDDSLIFLLKACDVKKNDFELLSNIGTCYYKLNNHIDALSYFEKALKLRPNSVDLLLFKAISFHTLQKYENSIDALKLAISIDPNNFLLFHHKAQSENALRKFPDALVSFNISIRLNPYFPDAYFFRGLLFSSVRKYQQSIESFDLAINLNNDDYDYFSNKALSLISLRKYSQATDLLNEVLALNPSHHHSLAVFGYLLLLNNSLSESEIFYTKAISHDPKNLEYLAARSTVYRDLNHYDKCMADLLCIYALDSEYELLLGNIVQTSLDTFDFENFNHFSNCLLHLLIDSNLCICAPLTFFYLSDSAELQLKCASIYTRDQYLTEEYVFPRYLHSKIRVAYYSSDFREHPVSHLIAELLELHNRDEFEVYAFALHSPNPNDPLRKRIELGVDHFFDVANISDQEIVDLSRKLEIDIAIDLGGHTKHARTQIFASRVAPIQANYLGFPGTMGASFMDYIIADQYVIPEKNQHFFSEKVAYLPGCFQVNDSKRRKSSREFTRKELGLPENAFVFCCFNQAYKITPEIFKCWMEILQAVEGSVLWLIDHNHVFKSNILRQAKVYFGDKEKVFFSPMIDSAENMKRYSCANIFLDTFPFNAGTTAAEVLGMGLPIVTISGESLASRYCGSLLHQMNLKELIMKDCREYITFSIQLASNLTKLNELAFNIKNKFRKDSLDSRIFSKNIENCYKKWMNH